MNSIAIIEPVSTSNIQFHGQQIITAMEEGVAYVAMKPIVENLGMSWSTQLRKINENNDKFNCVHMNMVATDKKLRDVLCMPLKKLNGWLFSINPSKVKESIRSKLVAYQEECFLVLHEYWTTGEVKVKQSKQIAGHLTSEQQEAIKQLVLNRGKALPKDKQAKAMITMWSSLKSHFGCTYKEIDSDKFTEALSLAARVQLEGEYIPKQEPLPIPRFNKHKTIHTLEGAAIHIRAMKGYWDNGLKDSLKQLGYQHTGSMTEHMIDVLFHLDWVIHEIKGDNLDKLPA
ncbi:hypothetical protein MIB43_004620 [Providencia rettgeri]|uniref:phage antirepressor N-terminal domain-containing protein n=1 Tax=Providencia rettgeri TaxID=587 RepID=UPI001F03D447|nr:phage antirepressor N-terminal domain-containing protein [Providencia rettgeri]MCG9949203.1 hypothetical protein [Providencia rettgeri]